MNIHEHQAKQVLAGFGAPISKGICRIGEHYAEIAPNLK